MDAGFGGGVADDANGLARAFAGAGVGLGALTANGQTAKVADAAMALDGLEALEVHANLAAQIAFDDVFAVLNRVNNLRELLLGQILGADAGFDVCPGEDDFGIVRADAVNVTQSNINALVWGNFYTDDTSHN